MTAKELLKELSNLESTIRSKKVMAKCFRELAEGMTSPKISDMPKGGNRDSSPMMTALVKALALEEEVVRLETLYQEKKIELYELMESIKEDDYRMILIRRYMNKESWSEIRSGLYYSKTWVFELHKRALEKLDDIIKQKSELD